MASGVNNYKNNFGFKQRNMKNKKFNPVGWFEIYVTDMDRAAKFYEQVFNIQLQDMPAPPDNNIQMKAFPGEMENAGASGTLVKMEGAIVGSGGTLIYFGCEDCAVEESRVVTAGGKICQPKMSIGDYGFCSIVGDTEGNTIGLHSLK